MLRRARLVVRKAHRLLGNAGAMLALPPHQGRPLTAIEWLCLAGQSLAQQNTAHHPLNTQRERRPQRSSDDGLALAHQVIDQLVPIEEDVSAAPLNGNASIAALAIDFVLNSSPPTGQLATLASWFSHLLSQFGADRRPIPHLPTVSEISPSLFAFDAKASAGGISLYRYSVRAPDSSPPTPAIDRRFAEVVMRAEPPCIADEMTVRFAVVQESEAQRLVMEKSAEPRPWTELARAAVNPEQAQVPITRWAVRLYHALLAMHQMAVDGERSLAYVPFRPQLFRQGQGDESTIYLVAERVKRDQLGVNAWYHDRDNRVQSVTVPFAGAELWRVGWAVADVLGVADDMAGETGERDEQLDELRIPGDEAGSAEVTEAQAKRELEAYVLRQQLRKLQGSYLSSAQIDSMGRTEAGLPRTVKRALALLEKFPANQGMDAQVRHVLEIEAGSRAMALRLELGSGDDMRHVLHRVFPEALNRLPLWVLQGLPLQPFAGYAAPLRPELGLMLSLYQAQFPATSAVPEANAKPLRVAMVLAAIGIGLRGGVAALWGHAQAAGEARMSESLNLPPRWAMADMERMDLQGDYSAMRKRLLKGDWSALCKSSPWQWMLALIGLLDASLPQAFDLPDLLPVYQALARWQTAPAEGGLEEERAEELEAIWPFDALPTIPLKRCDEVMAALPKALCALDNMRGMRVVSVQGQKFGRHLHTDEFTDANGASWQVSKPQFTSLFANTLPQRTIGQRKLTLWSETRRAADNELLAVHTLDHKLGRWFSFEDQVLAVPQALSTARGVPTDLSAQRGMDAEVAAAPPTNTSASEVGEPARGDQVSESAVSLTPADSDAVRVDRLEEWQGDSWRKRFGVGRTTKDEDLAARGHLRVALFQWRVDDSYSHPIAEAGLCGVPLAPAALKELQVHLVGDLKAVDKAAKRSAEFHWLDDRKVFSWPEHRRRVLLRQALRACRELKVQLLVLPEVSVRPDTVAWLKGELLHHPGLAVLAGTFRQFEAESNHTEHLKEKLTLLWQPAKAEAEHFGLQGDARVMQFQRDKKYRAVAAHELFRPGSEKLAPLYREDRVLDELRGNWTGAWTFAQTKALMQALIHGPQKLRYCMELICSELFLLTSPANRWPLLQDLAKVLQQFGVNATDAEELVNRDIHALGEWLTVTQANRERRSVLLVPACTSRSNDYWHAGQASVLASGTATVFCNAVSKGLSVGGSCFIGCDSVQRSPKEHPGIVRLLTPYHGWHHGILQPSVQGALSESDQALVVVDLDPVHMVSGKPRPQLLPEPMSLVAYLPVVEVIHKAENARALVAALRDQLKDEVGCKTLERLLTAEAFPVFREALHTRAGFYTALSKLLEAKRDGHLSAESGGPALDAFAEFFGDQVAIRQRIMACLRDHHQQPAPLTKADSLDLEPTWLDFLVADLTWKQSAGERSDDEQARAKQPAVRVPPWRHELTRPSAGEGRTKGVDPTAV